MSDRQLRDACTELREQHRGEHRDANATLLAVLRMTRETQRSRFMLRHVLLPAAAMLVATTAWAGATGRLAPAVRNVVEVVREDVKTRQSRPPVRRHARAPSEAASNVPAPAVALVAIASEAPPAVASSAPVAAEDPHAAAFAKAHHIHFVEHDPKRAIEAWSAYLHAAPHGRFAPEARYNRAIALLRLGREAEARPSLERFAGGEYGGYRQREARALLNALDSRE